MLKRRRSNLQMVKDEALMYTKQVSPQKGRLQSTGCQWEQGGELRPTVLNRLYLDEKHMCLWWGPFGLSEVIVIPYLYMAW
jgi:hypothetical protein